MKGYSEDKKKMPNFVHIETFMLKPKQLLDDIKLTFENKRLIM